MAEEQKHKSPKELGEAVGKKIEELFGGLFDEPAGETAPGQAEVTSRAHLDAAPSPGGLPRPASTARPEVRPATAPPPAATCCKTIPHVPAEIIRAWL